MKRVRKHVTLSAETVALLGAHSPVGAYLDSLVRRDYQTIKAALYTLEKLGWTTADLHFCCAVFKAYPWQPTVFSLHHQMRAELEHVEGEMLAQWGLSAARVGTLREGLLPHVGYALHAVVEAYWLGHPLIWRSLAEDVEAGEPTVSD